MSDTTNGFPADDPSFEDLAITKVTPESSGSWSIRLSSGWTFWVPKESPVAPVAGMSARLYGRGIGYTVRGLFLDGQRVFYRTSAEQEAEDERLNLERARERRYDFEKNRAEYDRRFGELPPAFQSRIACFRRNNVDFRWEYEPYELFTCEQAVAIAEAFRGQGHDAIALYAALAEFKAMDWPSQKVRVPTLSDGLSGNQFGCAVLLARLFLTEPEGVPRLCGAMAPLVGCEAYGCVPEGNGVGS